VLRTHVGFIGLTEHWAATVCLWHARFGGECHLSEMIDTRPGAYQTQAGWWPREAAEWPGDLADEQVYDTGYKLFFEQLEARRLDAAACTRLCPSIDRAYFGNETFTLNAALLRSTLQRIKARSENGSKVGPGRTPGQRVISHSTQRPGSRRRASQRARPV